MKHILFATTALVATAGFAQAEVTGSGPGTIDITGYAEIGVYGGDVDGDDIVTQFHTDVDVIFKMEGTSDNGLTFGATVDLDEADGSGSLNCSQAVGDIDGDGDVDYICDNPGSVNGFSPATSDDSDDGGATFFISGGGATLTMGDTDGAFDKAMREVSYAGGSLGDNQEHGAWGGYGNNGFDGTYDGQIARFDYSFDTVTASISAEMDDSGNLDPVWGLGVRYSGELNGVALGVGVGYQTVEDNSIIGLSVDAGLSNGVTAGFTYTKADFDGTEGTHGALGVAYEMNAIAVGLNYGRYTFDGDETVSGLGLAASYDMGGGLEAQLGYGHTNFEVTGANDIQVNTWSLGLAMSF